MGDVKRNSAMLMTKGILKLRQNPPALVSTVRRFKHPVSGKEVTLYPIPNIASPQYFRRVLDAQHLSNDFDKVLCEDGRLPFQAGTTVARKHEMLKTTLPFLSFRPVVANGDKFDGIVERDPLESRMAYQMLLDGADPPVDPRARRAIERIEGYASDTRTVCPWGVYHIVYMTHRLRTLGYAVESEEELEVVGMREVMVLGCVMGIMTFWVLYALYKMLFRF